jgi:hypothetical protein
MFLAGRPSRRTYTSIIVEIGFPVAFNPKRSKLTAKYKEWNNA